MGLRPRGPDGGDMNRAHENDVDDRDRAERAAVVAASERLNELAAELGKRGFQARVLSTGDKLRLWVQNRSISRLSDAVYAAPDGAGAWWIWWSWEDRIAALDDIDTAAFKIAYVLTPA